MSICVLPFANMSGDPEQEYFSDGITEDIITDLSQGLGALRRRAQHRLHVQGQARRRRRRSRGSSKVSHVLEGSVRKAGGRVRITAQLIDGATGGHVWAERYDRDLNDIFALQDEISQAIVAALKLKLLPEEKKAIEQRGTTNLEAYKLYPDGAADTASPAISAAPAAAKRSSACAAAPPRSTRTMRALGADGRRADEPAAVIVGATATAARPRPNARSRSTPNLAEAHAARRGS